MIEDYDFGEMSRQDMIRLIGSLDFMCNEHDRLMKEIPECLAHGPCVPHAIEWVRRMKELDGNHNR